MRECLIKWGERIFWIAFVLTETYQEWKAQRSQTDQK